jgi:signal transduction histidine kinase
VKLFGAHLLSLAAVLALAIAVGRRHVGVLALGVALALVAFVLLAVIALRPLRGIEAVSSRVRRGDFGARVAESAVADPDLARVGTMVNRLLDELTADRAHMRMLASTIIEAGDRERAALARELHDSTAQQLAALAMELSAAARDCVDPECTRRLQHARELVGATLEEVRLLAHTVHPRVLDDLGLPAALRKLARETEEGGQLDIEVAADGDSEALPPTQAATLYRVAQAAIHNVRRHASARRAALRLSTNRDCARLEIADDGRGFDVVEAQQRRPGMGLFTMRERVALVGGSFEVRSALGAGTRVIVEVPLNNPSYSPAVESQSQDE